MTRIAIAQINALLGDIEFNKNKILDFVDKARQRKVELVVFPESSLLGYHPFDLLERDDLVESLEKAISEIHKKVPRDLVVILGTLTRNKNKKGRPYYNSAVVLQKSKKLQIFNKQLLPTGDVFDEARFIEHGDMSQNEFKINGKKFFLTICEDIWAWEDKKGKSSYGDNPIKKIKSKNVDLVINLSASPWFPGKEKLRRSVALKTAQHFKAPILYSNLVGAQDEIIFDGASFVLSPKGQTIMQCQSFEEDLNVFDLKTNETWAKPSELSEIEKLRKALVLGIHDFCEKTGLTKIHLGLSGGIDSAVVACLAVDALGANAVKCFALPGPHSADISLKLALDLAKKLNVEIFECSINQAYDVISKQLNEQMNIDAFGLVHENLQSRLRGLFLMAYANYENSLLLTTGNKSEYATGYTTLYGDMCGGLAPIGDLTKNQVYQLARYYNSSSEIIPLEIIERAPSAELRPNQKDQDSLPAYEKLDQAVVNIVEKSKKPSNEIEKWLLSKLVATEFKRWQSAPILKASSHSFGRGRRWPLAHRNKF